MWGNRRLREGQGGRVRFIWLRNGWVEWKMEVAKVPKYGIWAALCGMRCCSLRGQDHISLNENEVHSWSTKGLQILSYLVLTIKEAELVWSSLSVWECSSEEVGLAPEPTCPEGESSIPAATWWLLRHCDKEVLITQKSSLRKRQVCGWERRKGKGRGLGLYAVWWVGALKGERRRKHPEGRFLGTVGKRPGEATNGLEEGSAESRVSGSLQTRVMAEQICTVPLRSCGWRDCFRVQTHGRERRFWLHGLIQGLLCTSNGTLDRFIFCASVSSSSKRR